MPIEPDATESMEAPKEAPGIEYVDATPRRPRWTRWELAAMADLDVHWVALIAFEHAVPRRFGDNRGMWPVHAEVAADWRTTGVVYDRNQPGVRAVRLAVIGVEKRERAEALKAAIDEALCGHETALDADPLRHRFRNMADAGAFEHWWAPLMQDALMRFGAVAGEFEGYSRSGYESAVERAVSRLLDQARKQAGGRI